MDKVYNSLDFRLDEQETEALKSIPLYNNVAFEFIKGWFYILNDLGHKIHAYCLENQIPYPTMQQIKEKFGTLRFYYTFQQPVEDSHKNQIREWVRKAEEATETTCEYCGKSGQMIVDGGVWKAMCPEHTPQHDKVFTVEEFTKIQEEKARKMRKCDICGVGYAEGYFDGEKFTNRCDKHKENFITSDAYVEQKLKRDNDRD